MAILRKKEEEDKVNHWIRNRIREARDERGMTQSDLATALYKTRAAVSDIERTRVKVCSTDLALIAGALKKPVTYFFPPAFSGIRVDKDDLSDDEQELVFFYRKIGGNNAMKKLALQQVKALADAVIEADVQEITREEQTVRMQDREE